MSASNPLVTLEGSGKPAILSYNVPEPSSYTGRNLIELAYDKAIFKEIKGTELPPPTLDADPAKRFQQLEDFAKDRAVMTLPSYAEIHEDLLTRSGQTSASVSAPAARNATRRTTRVATTARLAPASDLKIPYLVPTMSGSVKTVYVPPPARPNPGIYLVEYYRLSNFLGDYGAGKTVQTFSLLPGEKTTISITTFRNTSTTSSTTNSIFDSYTSETADQFESSIQSENASTESKEKTVEWYVDAEASGNWGVASASVSGGASGSTNTAREDFAKNVSTATEKHSQQASAQRDVSINTTSTSSVETGEQTAIEREISNINVGRTLNFVFRQLNQEFISLLHLVDVRVGFFNGYPDTKMEVPLHEIDKLLDYCIVKQADRDKVKSEIFYSLDNIFDHAQKPTSFLTTRTFKEASGAKQTIKVINRDLKTVFDPSGRNISIPGILLAANTVVLPTDGVIVEALLGEADALDEYSRGLQDEKVKEQILANQLREIELLERQARLEILRTKDAAAAAIYQQLFHAPDAEEADPQ